MGAGNEQATFSVNLEGNVSEAAREQADALEQLRARMAGGESAVKDMSAALRRLRGSSDEVKTAKEELRAKIQAEREAISSTSLALLKAGTSYEQVTARTKKLTDEQKKLTEAQRADQSKAVGSAIGAAGGPVAELRAKLESLKEIFGGGNAAAAAFTLGVASLAAAIAVVTAAAIAGAVALGKWVLESANAARTANLVREAVTGSATSARNLGDHIADLSGKLSTSKDKLQDLALSLAKTRLSGQAIVDTFNAVGQASDAMGDEVGNKLKDIATRMQLIQRFQLNPLELVGTGLEFSDVAASLAKQMKVGVDQAKKALFEGRVTLDAGAKALRDAVEKRFAEINARKALDLNVQLTKLGDTFRSLTRDIKLDPLLSGFKELGKSVDESTVTGAALKELLTDIGNGLASGFKDTLPIAKKVIQGLVIGALEAEIAWLKLRIAVRDVFGGDALKGFDVLQLALSSAKAPGRILADLLDQINFGLRVTNALVGGTKDAFSDLGKVWDSAAAILHNAIKGPALDLGREMVNGLVDGMKAGLTRVESAAKELAASAKKGLKEALGIASPSKVFEKFGEQTTEGFTRGVDAGAGDAQAATDAMVAPGAPSSGGGRAAMPPIVIHWHIGAGASPQAVQAAQDASPGMVAQFTKAIEDLLAQGGGAIS